MSDLIQNFRTFIRVAERLNFSTVAAEAHASHTTIARRMDQLEEHFGVQLLHRSTRRLALTREGERLLEHARLVVEEIEHAQADLSGEMSVRGIVRVGVTTALGLYYAERIKALYHQHPDLRVEFAVADWQEDIVEAGLDLALGVGISENEGAGVRPLGPVDRILVAAPEYLAMRGTPSAAAQLYQHDCIAYGYGPSRTVWNVSGEALRIAGPFRANSSEAVYRAVVSGLGIGLLPVIQVRRDIASGRLVRLLAEAEIEPLSLSVSHRFVGLRMPARVRVLLDFLVDEFPRGDQQAA